MNLKFKTILLAIIFQIKFFFLRRKYLYLTKPEKSVSLAMRTEPDPTKVEGMKNLLKTINHIHTNEYRKRKLDHFKPIRQKDGKNRNRQQPKKWIGRENKTHKSKN